METKRMLCKGDWDALIGSRPTRPRRPTAGRRRRFLAVAVVGVCFPLGGNFAADPVVPTNASTPTVPAGPQSVPSAANGLSPGASAIPGYGPGEGLPTEPGGPAEMPEMELIPPGTVPLQPIPNLPDLNLNLGPTPLVPQAPQGVDIKSLKYKVSKFTIKYGPIKRPPHPGLPPAQVLLDAPLTLGQAPQNGGLVGPGAGERDLPIVLAQVKTPETFSGDALQAIYTGIVAEINKTGVYGVFVVVDPDQINPSTGEDLRKENTALTLLVYASEVRQVRTIVKPVGKPPFKTASTIVDDPKYAKITAHSPLKAPPAKDKPGSLLERTKLQDYLDRINRFPGRRVDVAVTAAGEDAGVILDYIVHVEHPGVFLFNQTSNTGTEASGSWRTRIGGEVRQLTGLDDTLDLSFETSLSSETYSAFGSYQITPIFPDKLKFKVYGGYGRFFAEDVGFDQAQFLGKSGTAGLLAIYTPFYFKGFPLDLIAGVEYKNVDISDVGAFPQEGKANFLLPILGIATDRATEQFAAFGSVQVQANLPDVIGTDNDEIQKMGRFNVSRDFIIGRYNFGISAYLEPLLFAKQWSVYQEEADAAKRRGYWKKVSLAHEVSGLLHGQYTFADKRLIPQFEDVIGGFASVRGYPEAFTSGDSSVIFNAEYRFHVLRALKPFDTDLPDDPSKPPPPPPKFALRPPTILGRPDLDVILRGFYDVGYVKNNNIVESTEADRLLMSAGVGLEVQVLRYLNLRLDCGFPLISVTDKTSRPVDAGSPRLSFVGVISY